MAGFGHVDQAVKGSNTVLEYIKVGMDIANDVALDFVESERNKEVAGKDVEEFRKIMVNFAKMEQEMKHLQESVEFVKQNASNMDAKLEEMFDNKLKELKAKCNDSMLSQHEKVLDFQQKMWNSIHPGEPYSMEAMGFTSPAVDDDIAMTQQAMHTRCPYTGMDMVNPVTNKHCGHNYDRDGILEYVSKRKNKARCPLGGCTNEKPIVMSDLVDNAALKKYIERMNRNTKKCKK